ncbi:hypothetical protein [Phormidesmis priestleyi]|uniref:hypothetical protein n=1 Tax=Phormidesmis priestleyi TaxID=268141 RepID=UPI0018D3DB31|nr:hypothetical protein [Phormidesmis priestleyi]
MMNLNILESNYLQIDNFLTREDKKRSLNYVFAEEAEFVPTSTATDEVNYRRSSVLYSFPEFAELIRDRIQSVALDIFRTLELPPFSVDYIESQLTAHNDGNYSYRHIG